MIKKTNNFSNVIGETNIFYSKSYEQVAKYLRCFFFRIKIS